MTAYFLDSSALVKRYVSETGSAWIQQIADPLTGNELLIAQITWVDALARSPPTIRVAKVVFSLSPQ